MRWEAGIIAAMTQVAGLLLSGFIFGVPLSLAQKGNVDFPEKLVIAQHSFIDVGLPNDFYELIQLVPATDGVSAERILITPEGQACLQPAKVETRTAVLHESMSALLEDKNPCAIPEKELRRELKRCKKCQSFSGMNVTMEANCGGVSRRIRMDVLDRDLFDPKPNTPENTSWTMKVLEKVDAVTGPGCLDSPIIATGGPSDVARMSETATILALRNGVFDSLFGADAGIPQIIRESEEPPPPRPSVELVSVSPFMPIAPEIPRYPAIANAARQEGKVDFTFDVGLDGKVGNVVIISGNKMLERSVVETVGRWKFPPEANGSRGQGALEFKLNCHNSVRFSISSRVTLGTQMTLRCALIGRAFSPRGCPTSRTQGDALGWDNGAPSALGAGLPTGLGEEVGWPRS